MKKFLVKFTRAADAEKHSRFPGADSREKATDLYLITIFLLFPLFPGFSGYTNITLSKYVFWLAATGLWLAALAFFSLRERRGSGPLAAPQWAALVFLAVCLLSWLVSPWRAESFLGAGRYDGLLTLASYAVTFLGVSLFTRPKLLHAAAFAVGTGVCCAIGVLQLFGSDPLRLFPLDYTFYDAGTLYSGAYLGTVGNTGILEAVLCPALPLFLALYVRGESPLFLLPLLPACFLLAFTGGSAAAVAFGVCALAAGPLLLTDVSRLRRGLRGAALLLAAAGAALAYRPDYTDRVLTPRFLFSPVSAAAFLLAALLTTLSLLPPRGFAPSERALRRFFLGLDGAAVLAGLALLYAWPGTEGTLYELREVLHGHVEGGYGSSRVRIWRECLALVPERWPLGGGPGTLALRLDINFSRYVAETGNTLTSYVDNAHNIYLGYLVNCGVLGLAADLGLLACAVRGAVQNRKRPMTPGLALGVLCAAVHAVFGLGLCLSEPVFWAVLGLLCVSDKEGNI